MEFHFVIYRAAEKEPLLLLIKPLWLGMASVVAFKPDPGARRRGAVRPVGRAQHGNIIKAFHAQDLQRAAAEMRADLLRPGTSTRYLCELPARLSGGSTNN
jgi:DNA-binding GntR family transcriptional regulator